MVPAAVIVMPMLPAPLVVVMGLSTGGHKHTGCRYRGGQDGPPLKSTHYCLL
jgi:hypothetical protein